MLKTFWKRALAALVISSLIFCPVKSWADETRYKLDDQFPRDTLTREDWRSTNRGISQMDLGPLKAEAKRLIDEMEYSTNSSAQAQYSGTGVTISAAGTGLADTVKQEGTYSLKAVIDGTNNRSFSRTLSINLSSFTSITLWTRASTTASAIQFYVSDGTNSSYWDLTTDASADTWKQHTITLASPDSNSGSPASLSAVTSYGYRLLDNGVTYYFDTIKAIVGMTVSVRGSDLGSYYKHAYLGIQPLVVNAQAAPTITAPVSNPRIDILTIDSSGTLAWVTGTEASSPAIPWSSLSANKIPLCLVYNKTTETKILAYEDKDTDANQGYIYADVRPFLNLSSGNPLKGVDVASTGSMTLGNDGTVFDITGTTTITSITAKPAGTVVWLQFDGALTVTDGSNLKLNGNFTTAAESVLQLVSDGTNWYEVSRQPTAGSFISLSDTPSSYTSQAKKYVRVNTGATALEFITDPFDTTSGHDHDGTDAKKVVATTLDPTGITDGHYLIRSGSAVAGVAAPVASNILVAWSGRYREPGTGGHVDLLNSQTTKTGEATTADSMRYWATEYTVITGDNAIIGSFKFKKTSSINTLTFYAVIWSNGVSTTTARLKVNTLTADVTSGSATPAFQTVDLDVTSLSNGTTYDMDIRLSSSSSSSEGYLGAYEVLVKD